MELTRHTAEDFEPIRRCDGSGITVGDTLYERSIIVTRDTVLADWKVDSVEALDVQALEQIVELQPTVVLLGSGAEMAFPPPQLTQKVFLARQIGFEVMTTPAACRTYNVLAGEGRRVAAALIVTDSSD